MEGSELTVGALRMILRTADNDATLSEALEQLAEAKRRQVVEIAHVENQRRFEEYIERRRQRETEQVNTAARDAKEAAIRSAPISPERAAIVFMQAAHDEREAFEAREPLLPFAEWVDAGQPDVHQAGGLRDLLTPTKRR